MPQIANQDYNIVEATPGIDDIQIDAHILGELKRCFLQGTIFDVIVHANLPVYGRVFARVIATNGKDHGVATTDGIMQISLVNSVEQYEGLAAIQAAAIAEAQEVDMIPHLLFGNIGISNDELGVSTILGMGHPLVDEDGNVYRVTFDDIVTAVQKTQHAPEYDIWDSVPLTVPFEEVQKLVGLPISDY